MSAHHMTFDHNPRAAALFARARRRQLELARRGRYAESALAAMRAQRIVRALKACACEAQPELTATAA